MDALDAARQDAIWSTWRRLAKALPVARMPFEWVFSPSVYTLLGNDFVSGLLKNGATRRAFAVLAPLSGPSFAASMRWLRSTSGGTR